MLVNGTSSITLACAAYAASRPKVVKVLRSLGIKARPYKKKAETSDPAAFLAAARAHMRTGRFTPAQAAVMERPVDVDGVLALLDAETLLDAAVRNERRKSSGAANGSGHSAT
jgi:hypothetical protein